MYVFLMILFLEYEHKHKQRHGVNIEETILITILLKNE